MRRIFKVLFLPVFMVVCISVNAQKRDSIIHTDLVLTVKDTSVNFENVPVYENYYYPSAPLKFAKQLGLTAIQIDKLKSAYATLKLKTKETDLSIANNERTLYNLFRTGKVNDGVIVFYTNRSGLYQGEQRGAILLACYATNKILTRQQLAKLATLAKP